MSDADNARALHQDILNYIDEAYALLKAGNPQYLAGFDHRVEMLCERILALPEDERAPFSDMLEQLRDRMEDLTHQMKSACDGLQTEMGALNQRHRALKAYKPPKEGV